MGMTKSESGKLGSIAAMPYFKEKYETNINRYNISPKKCKECDANIHYDKRENSFCSQTCSAVFHNRKRNETRIKAYKPKEGVVCLLCGGEIPNKKYKMFCSNECRREHEKIEFLKAIENNTITHGQSKRLKAYMIELHGNICLDPDCAWDHTKRPIKVELEHKDGNSENNRLENLTLLCPCCHSLTPTYKNKNSGNGRAFRRQRYAEGKSY